MTYTQVISLAAACAAGFLGGSLASQTNIVASSPDSLRAPRFELVNAAGATVAVWESGAGKESHLRFQSGRGRSTLELGTLSDGTPLIQVTGGDGKRRIVMELDQFDKPMLRMGDEHTETRVNLGFIEPDTVSPDWDQWALSFRGPVSEMSVAGIGMVKGKGGVLDGLVTASGKRIR